MARRLEEVGSIALVERVGRGIRLTQSGLDLTVIQNREHLAGPNRIADLGAPLADHAVERRHDCDGPARRHRAGQSHEGRRGNRHDREDALFARLTERRRARVGCRHASEPGQDGEPDDRAGERGNDAPAYVPRCEGACVPS